MSSSGSQQNSVTALMNLKGGKKDVFMCGSDTAWHLWSTLSLVCVNNTLNVKAMCRRNTYRSHPLTEKTRARTHIHTP